VRTRLRKSRQELSRRRTRRIKLDIPSELQAPITAEVEEDLQNLVAKFGEKKVLEALDPLITKCKWNDWQCVANAVRRIARQK
jgi:hypothetical protein